MVKLVIKLKRTGRKNHVFTKLVIVHDNSRTGGKSSYKIGFWDHRSKNPSLFLSKIESSYPRNIVFNVRKFFYYYCFKGVVPKKKALSFIYYYFLSRGSLSSKYFESDQIKLYLYYEITKKKFFEFK